MLLRERRFIANDLLFSDNLIAVNAMVGNRTWFGGLFNGSGKKRQVNAEKNFEMTPLQVKLY